MPAYYILSFYANIHAVYVKKFMYAYLQSRYEIFIALILFIQPNIKLIIIDKI